MPGLSTDTLLLQVDVQANTARLVELQKQLNDNKAATAALNAAFKDGTLSADDYAAGQVRLKQSAADVSQEMRVLTKANADQQKATDAAKGSINQLRAELARGTAAYNALSASERDNTAAGQKLQAGNKALSDQLKVLEKAVGDTRRNVGNYKDDVVAALRETNLFGVNIGQTADNLKGNLTQGLEIAKKGFGSVRAAIASTGIGLLVLAFTTLFEYFQKTDEGAETLKAAFAAVGAVVNTVSGVVIGFGKGLVQAATEPKKSFADFADFLESQVLNRLKAFGVMIDAVKHGDIKALTNGFLQLNTGVEDVIGKGQHLLTKMGQIADEAKRAAKVAYDLSRAEDALDDKRRDSVVTLEREKNVIDKLVLSAKDRSLSEEQRLANLDRASQLEAKGLETTTSLAKEKLRIVRLQNAEAERTGKIQDEQRDAAAQAEAEVERLLGQSASLQQQIANRRSALLEEVAAARKAAAAEALERLRDEVRARQTRLELALLDVEKGSAAELAIKKKQVEAARDLELIAEKQTSDQKKLIRAQAQVEIKALQDDFNQKAIEAAQKAAEQEAKIVAARVTEAQREYQEAQQLLENYLNTKRAAIERDQAAGIISENEAQKRLNAVEKAGLDAQRVINDDYRRDNAAAEKKAADLEIKERNRVKTEKKKLKDAELTIQEASIEAGIAASDAVISALGEETEAGQAAVAIKKTLALAEIAINLEKQLSLNKVAAAELNALLPGSGIAYEIATDALAIAAAAASATKILGFKRGGFVSGPGTGTSDSIPARLSNGESVMNANTTTMFAPLLSHLNQLGGGVAFPGYATGGLVGQPASTPDGGFTARALGGSLMVVDPAQFVAALERANLEVGIRTIDRAKARFNTPRVNSRLG